ncbi:hypothetical protein TSAR_007184 [Trichomalopsis sarcophagae]|uniref:Ionotropic glutamate receptor L-glutamate and glycine-binding domain-containing protein n=1 Tax=Trichomalopsis sarcophagae TaxID=543379 RepID=A0A232FJB9_9HYME|nr:hypothetical protein TSAR_007184 [Trichomalopsis sarcophagae]
MESYPIRYLLRHIPPYLSVLRNENGSLSTVSGKTYPIVEILSKHLNFTIKFVEILKSVDLKEVIDSTLTRLRTGKIDMLTTPLPLLFNNSLRDFEIGQIFYTETIVALVPIRFVSYEWPTFVVYNLLIYAGLISSITHFAIFLKFDKIYWNYMNIFRVHVQNNEMPFNTLDDIQKSNLPIYVDDTYFNAFYEINQFVENKQLKFDRVYTEECVEKLIKNRDRICLTGQDFGLTKLNSLNNTSAMKMSEYIFGSMEHKYFYPKTSPYAKKFDSVIQKIIESGIHKSWKEYKKLDGSSKIMKAGNIQNELMRSACVTFITDELQRFKMPALRFNLNFDASTRESPASVKM